MEQLKGLKIRNSPWAFNSLTILVAVLFIIWTVLAIKTQMLFVLWLDCAATVLLMIIFWPYVGITYVDERRIRAKSFGIRACRIFWEDVRHVVLINSFSGKNLLGSFLYSNYFIISRKEIPEKYCHSFVYNIFTCITIRIDEKNVEQLAEIFNLKLGTSFTGDELLAEPERDHLKPIIISKTYIPKDGEEE